MTSVALNVDQLAFRAPGGIATYIRELAPRLAGLGADVTLWHARTPREDEDWTRQFRRVALAQDIRLLYPAWNLLGRPSLPEPVAAADVLHVPSPAAIPPEGRHQALVVTVHDLAFHLHPGAFPARWRLLFRLGTRRAAGRARAIVVPSESTRRDLVRLSGADPAKIHVVPLAASIPPPAPDAAGILSRRGIAPPFVLFVGTLEPRKNLVRLIRAYRRAVASAGAPHALVLAGPTGWRAGPILAAARERGPGRVVLTGSVPADDVDALYRAADLFVYPSLYEGFGLPVVEAMARGVPTITSTVSSLPEVAGDAAVLVDPSSEGALASAIEGLLTDRAEAARLASAGRARAERFTWDRTARGTLAVYERALG